MCFQILDTKFLIAPAVNTGKVYALPWFFSSSSQTQFSFQFFLHEVKTLYSLSIGLCASISQATAHWDPYYWLEGVFKVEF